MKKRINRGAALLAFAVLLLAFAGCSARSPITADDFSKQAKSQGFTVKDGNTSNAGVDKYLDAVNSETETEISFLSFQSESSAEETYVSIKKSISEGANANAKTIDSAAYSKVTVVNGELHHTLARMGSTIVYGKATSSHQNQVDDFFKAIKY